MSERKQTEKKVSVQVWFSLSRILWIASAVQHLPISNGFEKEKEEAENNRELQYYIGVGLICFKNLNVRVHI